VYEGGSFNATGIAPECQEPCLARLYPDYETLTRDGRFQALATQLYGPLAQWTRQGVTLLAQSGAAGAEAGDD
jgi:exodeoxyribonuclease V gamma subunit